MKRIFVLAEGQTEETFVRDVLDPHLQSGGICAIPVLLKTKRVKAGGHFKGGVTSGEQVLGDLRRLLRDSSVVAVTTLIDYFGLPADFPGMASRGATQVSEQRVLHVEGALSAAVADRRFIAHLTLHEYEAWIFSAPHECGWLFTPEVTARLEAIQRDCGGAEAINETRERCPSRRLLAAYPAYQKPLHGPLAVEAIGLPAMRAACPHADAWLRRLEML